MATLLSGERPKISGHSELSLSDYVEEIVASGLPGIRGFQGRARSLALGGYLRRIVDREIPDEAGVSIRNPEALGRWMTAYAAAIATSASFEKLRDAATSSANMMPSRRTVQSFRDALTRVWILDELPAWMPTRNHLNQLTFAPKHHLADPALACQLLGMDAGMLLSGVASAPATPNDGVFVGALFESLAALCVRACASRSDYRVYHMRTARGRQEVDLIVERPDGAVVAFEVKLTSVVNDHDVRHLLWLREQIGEQLLDSAVLTTGPDAYRRPDGVAVVPLAVLGP